MLDARSPVYVRIRRNISMGIGARAFDASFKFRIDTIGMDPQMVDALSFGPLFIGAADVI